MNLMDALRSSPVFASFDDSELAPLEKAFEIRRHEDGDVLIQEGKPGDAFFLIVDGNVVVSRARASGETEVLGIMGKGEVFGLLALVDDKPRSATCTADGEVTVACLPRAAFKLLHGADTLWGLHFQKMVTTQLARDARSVSRALLSAMLMDGPGSDQPPADSLSYDFRLAVQD